MGVGVQEANHRRPEVVPVLVEEDILQLNKLNGQKRPPEPLCQLPVVLPRVTLPDPLDLPYGGFIGRPTDTPSCVLEVDGTRFEGNVGDLADQSLCLIISRYLWPQNLLQVALMDGQELLAWSRNRCSIMADQGAVIGTVAALADPDAMRRTAGLFLDERQSVRRHGDGDLMGAELLKR